MRRLYPLLTTCSLFVLAGCEDGPKQTYEPSPASAATTFNDGMTPPYTDPGTQGYTLPDGGDNGATRNEICTGPEKQSRWAEGFSQPILPPRFAVGLDLAFDDTWKGLTLDEAEQGYDRQDSLDFPMYKGEKGYHLCQSTNDAVGENYWGDNGEVVVDYFTNNRQIWLLYLQLGYVGSIDFDSRPNSAWGPHHYTVTIGNQITRDGIPVVAGWDAVTKADPGGWANEFYDAAIYTFAAVIPPAPPSEVSDPMTGLPYPSIPDGLVLNAFGDTPYWYVPGAGFGFTMGPLSQGPKSGSTPSNIQMYKQKTLGFSLADATMKLNSGGIFGLAPSVGSTKSFCQFYLGYDFADFVTKCVTVTGDPTKDQSELNKLLGGLTHGYQEFVFDVQGIDINFADAELADDQVVADADRPQGNDYLADFDLDEGFVGKLANDYQGNDTTQRLDLHGTGLVYLEYGRLVQAELNKYQDPSIRHQLGDPACLGSNITQDPSTHRFVFPKGCTGFEGLIAPLDPNKVSPPTGPDAQFAASNMIDPDSALIIDAALQNGLRPGNPTIDFCTRLLNEAAGGCTPDRGGATGALWSTSAARVVAAMGQGDVNNLPPDVRDNRFFFKQYVKAFVKYLLVATTPNETPDGVHAAVLDDNDVFFDSQGGGQFEQGEYIYRAEVGQPDVYGFRPQDPTDFVFTADVLNGIANDYETSRFTLRGENAMYTEMLQTAVPGATIGGDTGDDVLLTNVFGSPLLANMFANAASAGLDPYYCATHVDFKKCIVAGVGYVGPIDHSPGAPLGAPLLGANGQPLLAPYKGAITGQTEFTIGLFQKPDPNDPTKMVIFGTGIQVASEMPLIESAIVTFPLHTDPFDITSPPPDPNNPALTRLVPWLPKQSGVGFAIPKTATTDNFITTYQMDLSGKTIDANIDYDHMVITDPNTGLQTYDPVNLQIMAVESSEFLGDLFLCAAPDPLATSMQPGATDLLTARMYQTVEEIMAWLASHPGAKDACDIVIRYSPYNNYIDYITSRKYGVQIAVTQGGGDGRVVDATLFDPNTVQ